MKKLIYFLTIFISIVAATAQPNKIHYQGILRGANGYPLQNNALRLRLSVLDSITTGSVLYVETQTTTTNAGGQFTVYLGGGTALGNPFASIPWEIGNNKYLKIEIDPNGGSNYQHFGTTLLVSVPFVLHAKSASEIKEGAIIRGNNGETYQISIGSNGPIWNCNPPVTQASSGADQWNLPGIVFNLSGNSPGSGNSGSWSKISGSGGLIEVSTSPNSVFVRGIDSIYSLEWKIQGGCGSTKDTTVLRFAPLIENQSCLGETQINYSGKTYPIVRIGNACWMAQNLDVGNRINGTVGQSNNGVIEKFCYNDLASNCSTYGGMYQWAEAVQYLNGATNSLSPNPVFPSKLQGICPTGWHLPTRQDWCSLVNFYDATKTCQNSGESFAHVGGALKSLTNWNTPNGGATNRSGFSAVSNGYHYLGAFTGLGNDAGFWSTQDQGNQATYFWLDYQLSNIGIDQGNKAVANAVRCVKDTLCAPTSSSAGPDQLSLSGSTATLAANAPASGETGAWSITTGSGGSLNSTSSPTATFTKGTDSAYTLVWTITGPCGTTRDTMNLRFPAPVGTACGQAVTYSGENYPTILIGNQCWLAKNLNVGTMIQGTLGSANQSNDGIIEKFCYNDNLSNCGIYGGLYQWAEAVQYQNGASNSASPSPAFTGNVRGICPSGWHLPSNIELGSLVNNVGGASSAGSALKSTSSLWLSYPLNSNFSGFSALPAGNYNYNGFFFGLGDETSFLSSSEQSSFDAFLLSLSNNNLSVSMSNDKSNGYSVRCVKDTLCAPTSSSAGSDQLSLSGTTATLAANAPAAGETGAWSITTGSGGSISASNNPTATFSKGTDSAYTLVWTITGPCGTSRDTVNLRFPAPVGTACGQAVTYAGESYPTVQIGTQCWFAKNLNVGTMIISNAPTDVQTNNGTIEKYCQNNNPANCTIYGGLYQWAEAVQYQNGATNYIFSSPTISGNVRGICPIGWHLPCELEFCTISTFIDPASVCSVNNISSTIAGGRMKAISGLWTTPNTGAINTTGFSAIPSGGRNIDGTFYSIGGFTNFWASAEVFNQSAIALMLVNSTSNLSWHIFDKANSFSVRCLKD